MSVTSPPRRRAFTLVELIVVIVVIGILAGIAAVSYQTVTHRSSQEVFRSNQTAIALDASAIISFQDGTTPSVALAIAYSEAHTASAVGVSAASGCFTPPPAGQDLGGLDVAVPVCDWTFTQTATPGTPGDHEVTWQHAAVGHGIVFQSNGGVGKIVACDVAPASATCGFAGEAPATTTGGTTTTTTTIPVATVPGAPTAVSATATSNTALVSFTAPADHGSTPIIDYTITSNPGGITATGTTSPITVSGLTNGTAYTFTVQARNTAGLGAASSASPAVTPIALPGQVTGVHVDPTDRTLTVTWDALTGTAAAPVTGYRVFVDGVLTTTVLTPTTTATVDQLTNGTAYNIEVASYGPAGQGTASSTVAATPRTVPDAPTGVTATATSTSLVAWIAPAGDGGSPITGYTVTATAAGQTTRTATAAAAATSASVGALADGVTYTISVVATNAAGDSTAATTTVISLVTPDQVTGLTATPADRSAELSWTAVADSAAAPVTGYRVYVGGVLASTVAAPATTATLDGLTNGTTYSIEVAAYGPAGQGDASTTAIVTPRTVPDTPTAPKATATSTSAVTWTAPASNGGSPITGYTVTATAAGETTRTATATGTSTTVGPLTDGVTYTISVVATNAAGDSTAATTTVLPVSAPVQVTGVAATPADRSVTLTWTALTGTAARPLTGYRIYVGGVLDSSVLTPSATVSNLTNGTTYSIQIAGYGTGGQGTSSATVLVTPRTVPDAPTAVAATDSSTSNVTWTPSASNGGSPITGYTVTATAAGETTRTATATGTSTTVGPLTDGVTYTISVVATNAAGDSTAATTTVLPISKPGQVTGVTATPGDTTAAISWTAVTSTAGQPVTGYRVFLDGVLNTTVLAPTTAATITSLVNGTAHNVQVAAFGPAGQGTGSTVVTVTSRTMADAPTIGTATAGNASATVTFTAPGSNGGAAITGYTVTATPGGLTATGSSSPITVTGLTNGTTYTFTVTAQNAAGSSTASAASNAVTPATIPDAPTAPTANSGAANWVTVMFTPPTSDGGSPITGYTVTASPGATSITTLAGDLFVGEEGLPVFTFTTLTPGTTYTFTVTAQNANGTGAASVASNAVTAFDTPDAPTIGTATAGNGSATVSFTGPTFDGGSPITGYVVRSVPAGWVGYGVASPITVTGLTNGTSYTFTVQASNAAGDGAVSAASNAVTPATTPGAPTIGTATAAGSGQVSVTFTAGSTGGSPITGYKVTSSPGGITATGASSPINVTGLANGTAYTFTVQAQNSVGYGTASAASNSVTPYTTPGAPTIGTASAAGSGQVSVTFIAPGSNGGSPITAYKVTSSPGGITKVSVGSPIFVTGLSNGTAYTFTVQAQNLAGLGAASAASNSVTPAGAPGAPTGVVATPGNTNATVTFTAPASNGGSPITSYSVTSSPGGITKVGGGSPITVSGLTNGTSYTFTVTATNALGTGAASSPSTAVIPGNAPATMSAPGAVSINASTGAVSMNFNAPSNGGSPITSYTVQTSGAASVTRTCATTTSPCTFNVPTVGDYQFKIAAVNAIGTGTYSPSSVLNGYCPSAPTPPSLTSLINRSDGNGGAFGASWSASAGGGCSIVQYQLDYGYAAPVYSGSTFSACIANTFWVQGGTLAVKVRAQNSAGVWSSYSGTQNVFISGQGSMGDPTACGGTY